MYVYRYTHDQEVSIPKFLDELRSSGLADNEFKDIDIKRKPPEYEHKIRFGIELDPGEEIELETIVSNCLGYERQNINHARVIHYIVENTGSPEQEARFFDFFNEYGGSFSAMIETNNYAKARIIAEEAESKNVIEQEDLDIIFDVLPESEYTPV